MKMDHVHFIREVMIRNKSGRRINTLQVSYAKPTELNPTFRDVQKQDRKQVQAVYEGMGGGRLKKWWVGLTIIIPGEAA